MKMNKEKHFYMIEGMKETKEINLRKPMLL